MKEDDLIYGAHSGVQKAVRRGDLDLAKTCFDVMWKIPKHRNWLKWRMTVLVEEDAWQMIGEFAQFLKEVKDLKDDPALDENAWRKFLYKLVVVPKSKDTEGLMYTSRLKKAEEGEHKEMSDFRFWFERDEDPTEIVEDMFDGLVKERKLTDYEMAAMKLLKGRIYQGGMLDDRKACLACMLLIVSRGLDEAEAKKMVTWGVKRWVKNSKRAKPRTVNLPWYVFDMHTAAGKFASAVFMKKRGKEYVGLTKKKFEDTWFAFESALIPKDLVKVVPYTEGPLTSYDSMWWPMQVKLEVPFGGYTAKGVKELWDNHMREEIRNIVKWCLARRDEEKVS